MKMFLEIIAQRLIKKFPGSMDHVAIVLPSKRAGVFLKNYLSKFIKKPIFLPSFFSIEEFVEYVSEYKMLDNISLQFYLYKSYLNSSLSKHDSFDEFISWSNILLNDFNEVDRNLVNPKSIFTNLKDVKSLEEWNMQDWSLSEDNLTDMQNKYLSFYEHI